MQYLAKLASLDGQLKEQGKVAYDYFVPVKYKDLKKEFIDFAGALDKCIHDIHEPYTYYHIVNNQ